MPVLPTMPPAVVNAVVQPVGVNWAQRTAGWGHHLTRDLDLYPAALTIGALCRASVNTRIGSMRKDNLKALATRAGLSPDEYADGVGQLQQLGYLTKSVSRYHLAPGPTGDWSKLLRPSLPLNPARIDRSRPRRP